ncbi:MAG: type II toxin-antitoxin system RelE/ParE family toxin [Cyanobacteria bacterium NC_groundwater_1444_Ag_S-0.65um_54_12]|nr:type II toxin-antitoxin system RelE/ParE family toxin [Cyanobacteria bacterium NC_groundwater_1444_Ag_S-0.65um_54_12]
MIRSFKDRESARVFNRESVRRLPPDILRVAHRKLRQIHVSVNLDDLRIPPGNRLEALTGDSEGRYSIRINDQWRICFDWHDGDAHEVEIIDYH